MNENKENKKINRISSGTFIYLAFYYLVNIIVIIFSEVNNTDSWRIGTLFIMALAFIYIPLKGIFHNIESLLFLIFLAFWLIPTIEFKLYKSNLKNYRISEEFIKSQDIITIEESRGKLKINDLDRLLIQMRKIQAKSCLREKISENIKSIEIRANISDHDTFFIPEPISMTFDDEFKFHSIRSRLPPRIEVVLRKEDSLITSFGVTTTFVSPSDQQIIEGVEREKEKLLLLADLKPELINIPYSEFLIDSVTAFTSGDISPARNLPKVLNGLQALIMVLLSTMVINSLGIALVIKRKKPEIPKKEMD